MFYSSVNKYLIKNLHLHSETRFASKSGHPLLLDVRYLQDLGYKDLQKTSASLRALCGKKMLNNGKFACFALLNIRLTLR